MQYFNLDLAIFVTYLIINLGVGIYYSRGTKTIKEYAVGRRNFSTGLIVSTVIATYVSGSGFFITLSKTYSEGLLYFISSQGMALSFIIIAYIFIPRMGEFFNVTSIAEAMGNFYGKQVRIIIAIAGTIGAAGSIAVQFKAFSNVFNYFLGIPANTAIFIAAGIMIVYSAIGGIRSIAYTDILQFFIFGFVVPVIGILVWNHAYSQGINLAQAFADPIFDYKQALNVHNPDFWYMIPIMLYFAIPTMKPYEFQDIIISRNISQAKKAFIITAICLFCMKLATAWIPFLIHSINPTLQPNHLLSYIIDNYTYPGLKGLIIIGIASMAMSSADAYLNASAVLFANDICSPLINISPKIKLLLSRLFALFLGFFALIIAVFSGSDLLKIILTANSFYMPIVTVPVFLTILGFRSTKKSVLTGMFSGLITVIIWQLLKIKADCIVFAMLVNLFFIIATHYLLDQPGGWKVKENNLTIDHKKHKQQKLKKFLNAIKEFNFIEFCQKNAPQEGSSYVAFGIFCLLSTFTIIYSTQVALLGKNAKVVLFLYQTMLVMSVCFITHPIWPKALRKELIIQIAWNFSILYLLIFCNSFFCIISKFGYLPVIIFTVNMIIAGILTDWKVALLSIITGIYLSIKLALMIGIDHINTNNGDPQFMLMYSLLLIGTAVIIFFLKPRQKNAETFEIIREQLKSDNVQKHLDLIKISQYREEFIERLNNDCIKVFKSLYEQISEIKEFKLKKVNLKNKQIDLIINIVDRLQSGTKYLNEIISQIRNNINLNLINLNFAKFIYKIIDEYKKIADVDLNIFVDFRIDEATNIDFDPKIIKKCIISCLEHGMEYSTNYNFSVVIEKDQIEYDTEQLRKLKIKREALKVSIIVNGKKLLNTNSDVPQISQKIISDLQKELYDIMFIHYGRMNINLTTTGEIIYVIMLPMQIKEIRPKKMNLLNQPMDSIKEVDEFVTERINEIIKNLIKEGMSHEFISKITNLNIKEIKELDIQDLSS